jgi:hypothetical protein
MTNFEVHRFRHAEFFVGSCPLMVGGMYGTLSAFP